MPTYEYTCASCGHDFERFESITAKPDKSCPKCKKKKAERRISAGGGFLFKGSGFYITDYKKSSGAAAAKPAESKPAENCPCDAKPKAACETKPASKSKTKVA
jgi:putative FmdB family regulatory protein